ncbi:hypothetical protein VNI00_019307, partial [Paramarasmius palmivorus]
MTLPEPPLSTLGLIPIPRPPQASVIVGQAIECPSLPSTFAFLDEGPRSDYTNNDHFAGAFGNSDQNAIFMQQESWDRNESHQGDSWENWHFASVATAIPKQEHASMVPEPSSYHNTNNDRFAGAYRDQNIIFMQQESWNRNESHQEHSWGNWHFPSVATATSELEHASMVPGPSSYQQNGGFTLPSSSQHSFARVDERHIPWDSQTG